jgi:hypothetical protein
MIKFDKVTLEPKFIDPSMCFCGGGGGGGGGGAPTKGTNAINRGTVGMSVAEMNRRADAQERGSREVANLSAGISDNISPGFGRSDPKGEVAGGFGDDEGGDDFVTSTEAAYRDLDRRAAVGQMPNLSKGFETPIGRIPTPTSAVVGALNKFGMNRAQDIRNQIRGGGVPVTDRYGRIQGVVSEGTGPVADILGAFGQNRNVYTGSPSFAPSTSQLMSYRPSGIASLPEVGSVFELDGRSFLSTVNGPVELKGTAERDVVTDFTGMRLGTIENPVLRNKDITSPSHLDNVPLQGVPAGIDPRTGMPNLGPQPQNIGLFSEDPRAAGFRDLGDNIQAIINNEPLPDNQNMYGPGMQDFGPLTPDQLENYRDPSLSSQYGTINDPTAQAGMFSDAKNAISSGIGNLFGTSSAQAKENRFKGSNVRTKPTGFGEFGKDVYQGVKNIYDEYIG